MHFRVSLWWLGVAGRQFWISTSKSLLSLKTVPVRWQVMRMTRCGDHETVVPAIIGMVARKLDLPALHVRSLCPKPDHWPGLKECFLEWIQSCLKVDFSRFGWYKRYPANTGLGASEIMGSSIV